MIISKIQKDTRTLSVFTFGMNKAMRLPVKTIKPTMESSPNIV